MYITPHTSTHHHQEPHKHQVEFLAENLPDYSWVGEGRNPVIFGLGEEVRGSERVCGAGDVRWCSSVVCWAHAEWR